MIAVAFPTIMDGLVVRWYLDEQAHDDGIELASASRNAVLDFCDDPELRALAEDVHQRIRRHGHDADLSDVLTHKRGPLFSRDLIPLHPDSTGGRS